jgi:hypothetical protein
MWAARLFENFEDSDKTRLTYVQNAWMNSFLLLGSVKPRASPKTESRALNLRDDRLYAPDHETAQETKTMCMYMYVSPRQCSVHVYVCA